MSAFDQDQPRETHYTITFLRRALPPPKPGFWARLLPKRPRSTLSSSMFPDYHEWADALLAALGRRFAAEGWPWTAGPWTWYEPDYRIETTVDGERVVLILVSPPREHEEGSIFSEDPEGAPISDEITARVFDVVRGVLQGRPEVYGLQEYPTAAAWRAAWEAKRGARSSTEGVPPS